MDEGVPEYQRIGGNKTKVISIFIKCKYPAKIYFDG